MPTLQWLDRATALKTADAVPFRLLEPVPELSAGDPAAGNLLIQGDNLDALKALLPFYAGRVKCIAIDPPYNTGSAFQQYDDNVEHSTWLSLMYPRFELLRDFLADDGTIWICVDDSESHYLKVMLDEIFGRQNFVANVVWQKKSSPQSNATWLSDSHDHILCYARNKQTWVPNKLPRTAKQDSIYKNSDEYDGIKDDGTRYGRGPWFPGDFTLSLASGQRGKQFAKTGESNNLYPITTPSGRVVHPANGRAWAYTRESFERLIIEKRVFFGKDGNNKPCIKRFLSELEGKGVVAMTSWHYSEVGENRIAMQEVKAFDPDAPFATPKPEALMHRIIILATNPGDLVLDSFLGSGTTAAVAHKTGRRYIGIEMGDHAVTHCVPRLKKVIEGEQGGISEQVAWKGGGGFRFMRLGPPVFDDNRVINPAIRFAQLAAHIWFAATKTGWTGKADSPLLGIHEGTAYYLLYNGILGDRRPQAGNVLNATTARLLPQHKGPKVVFGEWSQWGAARLRAERIEFRMIPYDITVR